MEREEAVKKICEKYSGIYKEKYQKRVEAMYGPVFLFDLENPDELLNEIIEIERNLGIDSVEISFPEEGADLVRMYSNLAYFLAKDSYLNKRSYKVAEYLKEIMSKLYHSVYLNDSDRKKLRVELSEAGLDFKFSANFLRDYPEKYPICSIRIAHTFFI